MGIFYIRNCFRLPKARDPPSARIDLLSILEQNLEQNLVDLFSSMDPWIWPGKFLADIKTGLIPYRRSEIRVTRKVVRSKRKLRNYDASTGNLTIFS